VSVAVKKITAIYGGKVKIKACKLDHRRIRNEGNHNREREEREKKAGQKQEE